MRIVKLSERVFGFDTVESCKSYFEHVLLWQEGRFNFEGTSNKIAKDKLREDENILFSYSGQVVVIAKAKGLILDNKVVGIELKLDTLKIFKDPISTLKLEEELKNKGFSDDIYGSQGWNIVEKDYERYAINFLKDQEWEIYS